MTIIKPLIIAGMLAFSGISYAQAATQNLSVNWGAIAGATKYQLQTRVETGTPTTDDVDATSKTVIKNIVSGQKFYAKVRACDAVWCGDYSPEVSFTMPPKPATPAIIGIQLIFTQ